MQDLQVDDASKAREPFEDVFRGSCSLERQRHRVPVKQARPIFSTDLRLLVKEIRLQLALLPAQEPLFPRRFPLLRDLCFFLIQWFSGNRTGVLGRALSKEVAC